MNKLIVQFNPQLNEGRPEGETIASVRAHLDNATGKFSNFDFSKAEWYERRAALNAIFDVYWGMYDVTGPLHAYSDRNPNKVGGALGWINVSKFSPRNGDPQFVTKIHFNRIDWLVTWPYHVTTEPTKFDGEVVPEGSRVVNITSNEWLFVTERAGHRLYFYNGQIDPKHGKCNGELKHSYVEALMNGIQLTIPVTHEKGKNLRTGEVWVSDKLQRNAQYHQGLIEAGDFDASRAKLVEARRKSSAANDALESVTYDQNLDQIRQQAQVALTKRANNEADGRTLFVNGAPIDLSAIKPGLYNIVAVNASGKTLTIKKRNVPIARTSGWSTLIGMHSQGGKGLEVVSYYDEQ